MTQTSPPAAPQAGAASQLSFQFVNYGADAGGDANVIYISSDSGYNKLTWQILLNTGSVELTPAPSIPDPGTLPPASQQGTLLYLSLQPLGMTDAVFQELTFSAPGWSFQFFAAQQMVGMTPTETIQLSAGSAVPQAIAVAKLQLGSAPQATVNLSTEIYDTQFASVYGSFKVALQPAPDTKAGILPEFLQLQLSSNNILNSFQVPQPVYNTVQLVLAPGAKPAQITAGAESVFNVSFVYGPPGDSYGYGALTTIDLAQSIAVTRAANADHWQIVPRTSAENVSWDLLPDKGQPIVGNGGEGTTIGFQFAHIATDYQPGPTALLVAYKNIPGYQDGVYTIVLNKIGHVVINEIKVTPNPAVAGPDGKAAVTVSWSTNDCVTDLLLTQNFAPTSVTGTTSFPATLVAESTGFTLTASGPLAELGNQATASVTATALPVINSFIGTPAQIHYQGGGHQATLSWVVQSAAAGQVAVSSTSATFQPLNDQPGSASVPVRLAGPQMITLAPDGAASPLPLTRNLVVSAFQPVANQLQPGGSPSGVAASPGAPFVAVSDSANSQVLILDTVRYQTLTTVPVGSQPGPIAFSADGSLMLVANTGARTLTPVRVSLNGGLPVFEPQSAVTVDGAPQSLLLSPDGKTAYVVADGGSGPGALYALTNSGQGFTVTSRATLGLAPRGLTALQSGAALYVANSGDGSVSVTGIAANGRLLPGTPIANVGQQPTGVALAAGGKVLLVSCAGDNTVVAIDAVYPNGGQRLPVAVGKQPGAIAVTPGGSYAYVANQGAGTLSLLDCGGGVGAVKVVGGAIQAGGTPAAVTVTPDGLNVLSANGAGSVTLVTLNTYAAAGDAIALGDHMTNAAVAPDNSTVFVWQNPLLGMTSTDGIVAYAPATGTQQGVLGANQVISCVFNPNPALHAGYALLSEGKQLSQIATPGLQVTSLPLTLPSADCKALALAMGADDSHLFVAYADKSNMVWLLVLTRNQATWSTAQTVQLYQASARPSLLLLAATRDIQKLVIVDPQSRIVHFCHSVNGSYVSNSPTVQAQSNARGIAILPDGSTAYVLNSGGMQHDITVIDLATLSGTLVTIPQPFVAITGIASAPDGRALYACDANAATLRLLDPASLRILQTIPLSRGAGRAVQDAIAVAAAPDASALYVVNNASNNLSVIQQIQMQ
jgi:DNA-binding beta-propeller fold protein YncE